MPLSCSSALLAQVDDDNAFRVRLFAEDLDTQSGWFQGADAAGFAVEAWKVGTSRPGHYIRIRDDLAGITISRAADPALLTATVTMPLPHHQLVAGDYLKTAGWRDWRLDYWRRGEAFTPLIGPDATAPAVLATAELRASLRTADLPAHQDADGCAPCCGTRCGRCLQTDARNVVRALAAAVSTALAPAVNHLLADTCACQNPQPPDAPDTRSIP